MNLSQKQIKYLKGLGHHLQAVVTVGKEGLSPGVLKELETTLNCHELIKVKISAEEREDFQALVAMLEENVQAALIQTIGRMVLLYREKDDREPQAKKRPKIVLPSP